MTLGGRRVAVTRPRARTLDGREVPLANYAHFAADDLLTEVVMERMLAGVATRRHARTAEPVGAQVDEEAKSTSRSAISRRFVRQTETALAELMSRDLSGLDIKVLMVDGEHMAERCVVVALAITADGTKKPVGLWDGSTENKTVVRSLLADLVDRGLAFDDGLLVVLDGAKALSAAVREVFGAKALIQRCTLHKRRNVADHLPDKDNAWVDAKLVKAFSHADPEQGLRNAKRLAAQLDKNYPSAAASLREGLEEMFTVARSASTAASRRPSPRSNPIESMISIARTTNRNVTRWRDGQMVLRWTAAGMLNAERSFRRIKGYKQMPQLVAALRRHAHPETHRHRICRCRRLGFTMDRHRNSTRVGTCSGGEVDHFEVGADLLGSRKVGYLGEAPGLHRPGDRFGRNVLLGLPGPFRGQRDLDRCLNEPLAG